MSTLPHPSKRASLKPFLLLLTTAAVLAVTPLTHAAVAVSNLGIADGNGWAIISEQYIGMSFTVGSDYSSWSLESVDIRAVASGSLSSGFTVELHADDGFGRPGLAALVTFTGGNPATLGDYNFVPATPFTLSAGVTYWLTAESQVPAGPNVYQWINTESSNGAENTALAGWSIGNNFTYSTNQGASWRYAENAPSKFAVNASQAVPEPGALGLLALGALAAATRRRRRVG